MCVFRIFGVKIHTLFMFRKFCPYSLLWSVIKVSDTIHFALIIPCPHGFISKVKTIAFSVSSLIYIILQISHGKACERQNMP